MCSAALDVETDAKAARHHRVRIQCGACCGPARHRLLLHDDGVPATVSCVHDDRRRLLLRAALHTYMQPEDRIRKNDKEEYEQIKHNKHMKKNRKNISSIYSVLASWRMTRHCSMPRRILHENFVCRGSLVISVLGHPD